LNPGDLIRPGFLLPGCRRQGKLARWLPGGAVCGTPVRAAHTGGIGANKKRPVVIDKGTKKEHKIKHKQEYKGVDL
jgi:hypothetical protein